MIRTALAVLYLMLSASPVSAECAWVLWVDVVSPKHGETYKPDSSYSNFESCKKIVEMYRANPPQPELRVTTSRYGPTEAQVLFYSTTDGTLMDVKCLPDTVDPRAPKASGR